MDQLLGHRQTKGAATDNAEPNATAPHLDSTEAVSKRKITEVGGNRDLYYGRNKTKVGLKVSFSANALPMWCAVPLSSKSGTFSHSLGRKRTLILVILSA